MQKTNDFLVGKLNYHGLYIMQEYGDRNKLKLSPKEIADRLEAQRKDRERGSSVNIGGTNVEVTEGYMTVYDDDTSMFSDNIIYNGKKGFYIKKRSKKYYLDLFDA